MKSLQEIITDALAQADADALRSIQVRVKTIEAPTESLPHAIGCSTSGHEVRTPSKGEINNRSNCVAPGHYAVFCTHNVPFWKVCRRCGRNAQQAAKQVPIVIASLKRIAPK